MIYMPIIMSALGLAYVFIRRSWVMKQDVGDGKMKEISDHIYEGALAFLNAEYRLLSVFVLVVSAVLAGISFIVPTTHILIVVSFIFGAFFSAYAGNIGMKIATKTNVRTTQAAKTSLPDALKISFAGGTVMGLGVAGLAVLGLTAFFIIFFNHFMGGVWADTDYGSASDTMTIVLETLAGFSFGAWIAMQLLMRRPEINRFVAISPQPNVYDFSFLAPCPTSGQVIYSENDELVSRESITELDLSLIHI